MKKPKLSEMTLREKIGQCLLTYQWEINQNEIGGENRTEAERIAILEKEQFGVFYGEQVDSFSKKVINLDDRVANRVNSAVYKKYIDNQSKILKIPALSAADCEMGAGSIFEDLTNVCNALSVGSADSEEMAYELGVCVGKELRCGGINWRWTPILDLPGRFYSCIMRGFAPDYPERMAKLAKAHIRGLQSVGVAATAKHFPGADRYEYRDSHFTNIVLSMSFDEWRNTQGKLFQDIIDSGVYSVMVGHQAFPAADNSKINGRPVPSTLSKKVVTDLLKGEMGFGGVVITDAITMNGIYNITDYESLVVGLINAGNDVLLGAKLGTGDVLEKAVNDGRISLERIDDACTRILDMKEKLGMFEEDYYELGYSAVDVAPITRYLNRRIARKSVTSVKNSNNIIPIDRDKVRKITIICSSHDDLYIDDMAVVKEALELRGAEVRMQRRLESGEELAEIANWSDLIIYAAFVAPHKPEGGLALYGAEAYTYFHAFNYGKEKSVGVSMGYPYVHYDIMGNCDCFVNTYGKNSDSMLAFVEALYGEITMNGKSPVKLVPDNRVW